MWPRNSLTMLGRVTDCRSKQHAARVKVRYLPPIAIHSQVGTAWTESIYDNGGRLTATRAYSAIPATGLGLPGTNYEETDYGYDIMDRRKPSRDTRRNDYPHGVRRRRTPNRYLCRH